METNLTSNDFDLTKKQKALFEQQKRMLDLFLEKKAISKAQYDKSLKTLIEKIGIE